MQAVRLNGDENDNRGYTVLSHLLNYLLHDGYVKVKLYEIDYYLSNKEKKTL